MIMSTTSDIPERFTALCNSVSKMAAVYQVRAVNAWLYTLKEAVENSPAKRKKLNALKPFLVRVGRKMDNMDPDQPIIPTRQEMRLLDATIDTFEEAIMQISNNFAIDADQIIRLINQLITG